MRPSLEWKRIWQSSDEQARAHQLVDETLTTLVKWAHASPPSTSFAEVLLLAAVVSARRELDFDLSELANRALEATQLPLTHTLFGTLGFGLTLQHALSLLGTETDEVCEQVDEGLHATLKAVSSLEYDLIEGAAGRLVYLSHRPDTSINQASRSMLFEALAAVMHTDETGCWWELKGNDEKDLGVSHGSAGVISALAACASRGWAHDRELGWLTRGVDFLLSHQNTQGGPFRFPYAAGGTKGRLAWCYGDLGIAMALLQAGRATKRDDWEREALHVALHVAGIGVADARIEDASICHGAAGAGLVFANLAYQTGSDTLWRAATDWFARVSSFRQPEGAFGGFRFKHPGGFDDRASVLEGAAGIALCLESACGSEAPTWPTFFRFA